MRILSFPKGAAEKKWQRHGDRFSFSKKSGNAPPLCGYATIKHGRQSVETNEYCARPAAFPRFARKLEVSVKGMDIRVSDVSYGNFHQLSFSGNISDHSAILLCQQSWLSPDVGSELATIPHCYTSRTDRSARHNALRCMVPQALMESLLQCSSTMPLNWSMSSPRSSIGVRAEDSFQALGCSPELFQLREN
ncbi:unnamed protein product [Soboliphyme baturini]|uniref:Uncharacterized protein n=1 Tax=Soboliphyme baturini TaxID=241478 RepID=A0A183IV35_9BILA|nr:unnamed protein product [Soboliphyme baturini]